MGLLNDEPKKLTREQVDGLEGGYLSHVFSSCDATLTKAPFAFEAACEWLASNDSMRRRCAYGLLYEFSKMKKVDGMTDEFLLECISDIQNSIHGEESMWVREVMNRALMGIGKRNKKLNQAAIKAAKAISTVDIDYGDDNSCEPLDVLKHLQSEYVQTKFAKKKRHSAQARTGRSRLRQSKRIGENSGCFLSHLTRNNKELIRSLNRASKRTPDEVNDAEFNWLRL